MDFGADVNVTTHKGRTPLHMAAQGGGDAAVRVVELLLEGREGGRGGGSVMVRDGEGRCVFDFASERVLEFLKEREPYLFKVRKGREGKGREGKGREGKGRDRIFFLFSYPFSSLSLLNMVP